MSWKSGKYQLHIDDQSYRFKNKDDLIYAMMVLMSGDGVVKMKIVYPDGSWFGEKE